MAISKTKKAKLKFTMPNNCWYCGSENPDTVDHVIPVSKGGADDLDNLVLSCKRCNSRKRDLSLHSFRFHVSWGKTSYSDVINSGSAKLLIKQGVKFNGFKNNHKFWFEGL